MKKIEIAGYKSIEKQSIELKRINILIGANGSGKSNFISFFKFLNQVKEKNLKKYVASNGGADRFLFNGRKKTNKITWKLDFGANKYAGEIAFGDPHFIFNSEKIYYNNSVFNIADFGNEANIKGDNTYRSQYIRSHLSSFKVYHFHDTSINSPFNSAPLIKDSLSLGTEGHNIAAILYRYRESDTIVYNRIITVFKSVVPYFRDFEFIIDVDYISLGWYRDDSEMLFRVSDLSDGSLRFLALCLLFLQPDSPNVIIIDEPELGLHPFAITKLAGLIQSFSEKGSQVIAATQSPFLVSHFEPQHIITVDQIEGASTFERLENEKLKGWLEDYSLGDLWEQKIIKGQPNT